MQNITKTQRRQIKRQPLTTKQVEALLGAADQEWRGMILTGLYTGQRLLDIANLRWRDIDLEKGTIRFYFAKQGRPFVCPMVSLLVAHLASLAKPADPEAPVFPSCYKDAQEGPGRLTARFRWLQRKAGLEPVGFYSLRYTFINNLLRIGTPDIVVQQAIGMSDWRHYPVALDAIRKALEKLPGLGK